MFLRRVFRSRPLVDQESCLDLGLDHRLFCSGGGCFVLKVRKRVEIKRELPYKEEKRDDRSK